MKNRENDDRRLARIAEMRALLEHERPWIELFHPEDYALVHGWLRGFAPMGLPVPTWKYYDVEPDPRAARRAAWNQPVRWPLAVAAGLAVALLIPGIVTWRRERRA
ncbi:MAG: hypothetical protein M5U32_17490 [Myxococcota bacterium]|nr:hypothetical protein [Myxococcota bacterium]